MSTREAMQRALIALECHADIGIKADKAIELLKQELEKPELEPVGWLGRQGQFMSDRHYVAWARKDINNDYIPLYRREDL